MLYLDICKLIFILYGLSGILLIFPVIIIVLKSRQMWIDDNTTEAASMGMMFITILVGAFLHQIPLAVLSGLAFILNFISFIQVNKQE